MFLSSPFISCYEKYELLFRFLCDIHPIWIKQMSSIVEHTKYLPQFQGKMVVPHSNSSIFASSYSNNVLIVNHDAHDKIKYIAYNIVHRINQFV